MLSPLWLEDLSYHRYIFLIAILTYSCFSLMCINYFNILLLPKSGASCRGWKSTYCQPSQYSRALGMPAPWFIHTQVARIYRVNSLLSQSVPIGRSKWLKFSSKYSEFTYYTFETPFRRGCKLLLLLEGNQPNLVVVQGGERGVFRSLSTPPLVVWLPWEDDGATRADDLDRRDCVWSDDRRLRSGEKSFYKFHSVAFPFWRCWGGSSPLPFFRRTGSFPGKR